MLTYLVIPWNLLGIKLSFKTLKTQRVIHFKVNPMLLPNYMKSVCKNNWITGLMIISACTNSGDEVEPKPIESSIIITSFAPNETDHNREYIYNLITESTQGDTVIFNVGAPSWLDFDNSTSVLSGIADWPNLDSPDLAII